MFPYSSTVWVDYAEFEASLEEYERAREIYELAIKQSQIDLPERVWQSYLNLEISLGEYEKVRDIYSRLLARSKHLKVWISYAKFESENAKDPERTRKVYNQAYNHFKDKEPELKEERLMILENWIHFEEGPLGDASFLE